MRTLALTKTRAVLLSLLAIAVLAAALASATGIAAVHAQSTSSGPTTWHVLVGGQSADGAIQARSGAGHRRRAA